MTTTDIINQVKEIISTVTPEERQHLIEQLEQLFHEPEYGEILSQCPRCECDSVVRKGTSKGGQRYLCKGCQRTFGHSTNKVLKTSKLSLETWRKFAECFIDGVSVRRSAERCGVAVATAFFMRHRVLELVEKNAKKVTVNRGNLAYIDETFFPINYKGAAVPDGVKAKKRGGLRKGKSQSRLLVCVVMGVTSTGSIFHQIAGYSSISKNTARLALGDIVTSGCTVITDKGSGYVSALEELGATHRAYHSKDDRGKLAPINALHSKTKRFMRRFSSVASKNLHRYLSWMEWIDNNTERETLDILRQSTYTVHRCSMNSEHIPPMDDLTRRTITGMM
ncbi:IS1595 family transposase [Corynebacterium sp. sy039]|uniref:IS1595 family transposase n=2 Tax=Corynebacterium sp. sy039 TaxID=2599641 RepID=UPI0011B55179|nr:IS1595 family transposase [Corynebacterium sp. sy039]QDZ43060.1 IS1595 family transposase [Corynebacterium sp. sy039]QDZ43296.1 IS1595 family transposase [Corynebacterium sp. sy039]QDZ43385.1 IS1595 family transposase [Corynebacterium sp. sy039]